MVRARCGRVSANRLRASQHHWRHLFHFIPFVSVVPLDQSKFGSHVLKILLAEMPTMSGRVRPIEKFAEAVGKCSVEVRSGVCLLFIVGLELTLSSQAAAYGKCIVADYQSVHQNMCAKEFMRLKDCYLVCGLVVVDISLRIYGSTDTRNRKLQRSPRNDQL